MKHATAGGLDRIDALLGRIRALDGLVEKKRGVWYRKSRAFLHFHEDPAGMFADLRVSGRSGRAGRAGAFERFPVNSRKDEAALIRAIRAELGDPR